MPRLRELLAIPVRELEVGAARRLLDVPLADAESPRGAVSWATRRRSAAWFVCHLVLGLWSVCSPSSCPPPWSRVALVYLAAGASALLARIAPRLLGPSPAEPVAALQRQAVRWVRMFCAWLRDAADEQALGADPLADLAARDYAARDFKRFLKSERALGPASVNPRSPRSIISIASSASGARTSVASRCRSRPLARCRATSSAVCCARLSVQARVTARSSC